MKTPRNLIAAVEMLGIPTVVFNPKNTDKAVSYEEWKQVIKLGLIDSQYATGSALSFRYSDNSIVTFNF